MNDDILFLDYLYQKIKINQETLGVVVKRIEKFENVERINDILKEQIKVYIKNANSIKKMFERRNKEIKDLGILTKMVTHISIKSDALNENYIGDVINILIQSSNILVQEVLKKKEEYNIHSKTIINLAQRLILSEQKFIELLSNEKNNYLGNR